MKGHPPRLGSHIQIEWHPCCFFCDYEGRAKIRCPDAVMRRILFPFIKWKKKITSKLESLSENVLELFSA